MTFDEVADLYDTVRPTYPDGLVDTIASVLNTSGGRILEVGCGTGQATSLFARRGHRIVALEPGPRLAALASDNLSAFPGVTVETTTFEAWTVQKGRFDAVMSATAFHWVAPEIRYAKAAQALADGGWLALFWNVAAETDGPLAQQIQAVYERHMPPRQLHPYATHHPAGSAAQQNKKTLRWAEEIEQSRLFGQASLTQFPWSEWYTTARYLQLLETYSDHRTLPQENKRLLFDGIKELLARNGDGLSKPYLSLLYLAQKS